MGEKNQIIDSIQKQFGEVIRKKRNKVGISQEKLAEFCDLHRNFISEIERGVKSPSLKTIILLAIALDCSPSVLLKEAEDLSHDDIYPS
ncbi:helix-turn-helix domain-containing protein [Geminocystis herdmanii]|uniref:helix-turn-helix domain-containing protein n=1 Tax=Geminocystis herdmanii TaxID=669359 RepID=UPI00034D81D3|nr:helix-turn-helix transcriptional regulator [Geminocystis herdmanii]